MRIVRGERFGELGRIKSIPQELTPIGSGAKALAFELTLKSGEQVIVPRPNVELIGG